MTSSRSDIPAGWTEDRFTDLTVRESRGQIPKAPKSIYQTSGAFPVVDQGQELIAGFVDSDELRFRGRLPAIVFGDHTRIFKYVNFPFVAGADGTRIVTPLSDRVDVSFFYYALCNLPLKNLGYSRHFKLLKEQIVRFPESVREQRKIAAILSSMDDAIEKTQAVIDQVQVVKRGLMQELLTRGLPGRHTRFKQTEIGEIPEEWDAAPLGNRAELQPGFPFKSRDFAAGGDRLLRGSNVGVGRLVWTEDKTEYFPSARRAEVKDYELRDSDIVVAMDRPFVSDGFKVSRVTANDLAALLLQRVGRFRHYRGLTPGYLWQLLQSGYVQGHLQITQKGTDLPHISKTEIESAVCPLPPVDEQESIARCLDTFDAYSTRLEQERRQATKLKTGLMSVLLTGELCVNPAPETA